MKIFIDTNIFLDMYRKNTKYDVIKIMKLLKNNRGSLFTVRQLLDELERNRYKVIDNTISDLKNKSKIELFQESIVKSLNSYDEYVSIFKEFQATSKKLIRELENIRDDKNKDKVYSSIIKVYLEDMIVEENDVILKKAHMRKLCGKPPTSSGVTIGDEIIWESILEYGKKNTEDIVLVSNDKTFFLNKDYLMSEYENDVKCSLHIVGDLYDALKISDINIPKPSKEILESMRWTDLIVEALENLDGQANLNDIYNEVNDLIYFYNCSDKSENKAQQSTVRGILQRFSSDCKSSYNGKVDLFQKVEKGIWKLR